MAHASTADPTGRSSARRLRDALAQLSAAGSAAVPTATMLCELAGVSRNALYRYHPDALHELHKLQRCRSRGPSPAKHELQRLRDENEDLREQMNKIVALVDHYYAAWHESRTLLERRERELAEVRRNVKPQLIPIRN